MRSPVARHSRSCLAFGLIVASHIYGCSRSAHEHRESSAFEESAKKGNLSLTIVGDYFDPRYVRELTEIATALAPEDRPVFLCTPKYERALRPLLEGRGVEATYHAVDPSASILRRWARDIAISGARDGKPVIVASPDKHARTREEAEAGRVLLQHLFPEHTVEITPFVFEGGNLVFVRSGSTHVLIVGRKVFFDNDVYKRRAWAGEYDRATLSGLMAEMFGVDRVMVVGRAERRPDSRLYFEYHIDMGMTVLDQNRAVVSRLEFGEKQREELRAAVRRGDPVTSRFRFLESDAVIPALTSRLETVSLEYEDYATTLKGLGLEVHRSPVEWRHVIASMSWTNVAKAGNRILMPVYPDSLRAVTRETADEDGLIRVSLDASGVEAEEFTLSGFNLRNYELYESLGYDVVPVPEYLHYMGGGIHCFVNVMQ